MIDSVVLQTKLQCPIDKNELEKKGFEYGQRRHDKFWIKYDDTNGNQLALKYKPKTYNNPPFLQVSGSLPKFYYGNNVTSLKDADMPDVFSKVSVYASHHFGTEFNAATATVLKLDYCYNFKLNNEFITANYLKLISKLPPLRNLHKKQEAESVYFLNNSRCLVFYDKHAETKKQHKDDPHIIEASRGILRCEYRLKSKRCCNEVADLFRVENNAENLMKEYIAKNLIEEHIKQLGVNNSILSKPDFDTCLKLKVTKVDSYRKLRHFLKDCFEYGATNLVKLGYYSKNQYYRLRAMAKEFGVWNITVTDLKLPPLSIISYE